MSTSPRGIARACRRARLRTVAVTSSMAVMALAAGGVSSAVAAPGGAAGDLAAPAAAPDTFQSVDHRADHAPASAFARVADKAKADGSVRVIVGLQTQFTPEGALNDSAKKNQHAEIA